MKVSLSHSHSSFLCTHTTHSHTHNSLSHTTLFHTHNLHIHAHAQHTHTHTRCLSHAVCRGPWEEFHKVLQNCFSLSLSLSPYSYLSITFSFTMWPDHPPAKRRKYFYLQRGIMMAINSTQDLSSSVGRFYLPLNRTAENDPVFSLPYIDEADGG